MVKTYPLSGQFLTDGLVFPEGPIALDDGSVLVVEIRGARLIKIAPDGTKTVVAELGGGPNGAAIGPDGACYIANNGGFSWSDADGFYRPTGRAEDYVIGSIQRVDLTTGEVRDLYTECNGITLKGPNDIVFDSDGNMWFTDHGKSYGRLMDRGAIYFAKADGSFIKEVAFPCITPNGIGVSPDGKTLYVSETETGRLWAWEIKGLGDLVKLPFPSPNGARFIGGGQGYQRFDSMALEENGNICVASLVKGGISVFSPEGGLIEFWEISDHFCTNICFGGPDMRTAYITLSDHGRLLEVEWPRAGMPLIHQKR